MTARTIFITGTDTGVGKTHVTCELLRLLRAQGVRACGFKPVSSGCARTPQGLRNEDALALQMAAEISEPYEAINPYAFEPAIAPHLAAMQAGLRIDLQRLNAAYAQLASTYDVVLIEGAGGWQVPLTEGAAFADWVATQDWPVVLVVGMRLGCINHAMLSAESIMRRTRLLGWIANPQPPVMPMLDENIDALRQRMPAPLLHLDELSRQLS
jgi:dethiobiotin synthetase